jgi:hypothetical protein
MAVDYWNYICVFDPKKYEIVKEFKHHMSFTSELIELPNGNLISINMKNIKE